MTVKYQKYYLNQKTKSRKLRKYLTNLLIKSTAKNKVFGLFFGKD